MQLHHARQCKLYAGSMLALIERYDMVTVDDIEKRVKQGERCPDLTPDERVLLAALRADLAEHRLQIGTMLVEEAQIARAART